MKFSYSRIECFASCPYKYKLRYIDKLGTLPDQKPDNALYLGTALHLGLETGSVERAVEEYKSNYYILTDDNINEIAKLEVVIPKALALLPDGVCEVEINTDEFVGFIDRLCPTYVDDNGVQHWDLYDYKYCSNEERYRTSKQLHIYKHYYELTHPNNVIDHLYYLIIKKVAIRQKLKSKPPETLQEFRDRLSEHLAATEIFLMEIEYEDESISDFEECCQCLKSIKEFPRNNTPLCNWCEYKAYCESDGQIDYMIINKQQEVTMATLPENKKKMPKVNELPDVFLYGQSYVGKSTFMDGIEDIIIFNTDGNTDELTSPSILIANEVSVNGRLTTTKLAWEVFREWVDELEKKQNSFKYVGLDLLEDLRELCRVYIYQKMRITHESDMGFGKAYDMVTTEFNTVLKRIKAAGYHLVICAKEVEDEVTLPTGGKYTTFKPNVPDKVANTLAGLVDVSARAYVDGNGKRWLQLAKQEHTFGGGRYNFSADKCDLSMKSLVNEIKNISGGNK